MSIDFDMGIPFLPEDEEPAGDNIQRMEERNRRLLLLGGAMSAKGGYLGPVYPMPMVPLDDEADKDPNP